MDPETEERVIHPRDRAIVAWTYLAAVVPLFGILVAGLIHMAYKERSRTVIFHAKQAIAGQAMMLLVFVVVILFYLFARLVGVISPWLGDKLTYFDLIVLYAVFLAYMFWCFYYAWMSLDGRDLDYPLVGPQLRDRSE